MKGTTVVFDLDGTMIDTAPDLMAALNYMLGRMGLSACDLDTIGEAAGLGARAMIERAAEALKHDIPEDDMAPLIDDFIAFYRDNISVHSRPFPLFEETLAQLRDDGATLAVCTNKREHLALKLLAELRLDGYFASIVGGDSLPGIRKPHPGHLVTTIARAGGDVRRAVMVGDSSADILASKAAAVPIILVGWGHAIAADVPSPDATIQSFAELRASISTLLA